MSRRPTPKLVLGMIVITLAGFAVGFIAFELFGRRPADKRIELPPVTLPL